MRRLAGLVGAVAFLMVLTAVPVGAGNATGLHWGDGTADGTQFDPGLTVSDSQATPSLSPSRQATCP